MTQRSTIYQQTLNQTLSLKSIPPPPPPPPPSLENSIKFFTRNNHNNSPCIMIEDSPANYLSEILNGKFNLRPVEDLETWKKETKLKSAKNAIENVNLGTAIAAEMERRRIAIRDEDENNGEDDELWY